MNGRIVMVCIAFAASSIYADTEVVDGIEWAFTGTDGEVSITKVVGGIPELGKVVVPSTLGGWPVTRIGCGAFRNTKGVRSVEIPPCAKEICMDCFAGCENLECVKIAAIETCLASSMFHRCKRLKKIDLPELVQVKKTDPAFVSPAFVSSESFRQCTMIGQIKLPSNIAAIFNDAFSDCYSLRLLHLPRELNAIHDRAFAKCYSLEAIVLPEGFLKLSQNSFFECINLRNVVLPSTQKEISGDAFDDCFRLEKVVFLGKAPKGLPVHWFYGADVYCYADCAASYTKANPNLIVKQPSVTLKELCGVTFTNSEKFVLLVDKKAAARAKANAKRWAELDAKAKEALAEVEKPKETTLSAQPSHSARLLNRVSSVSTAVKNDQEKSELARRESEQEERSRKRANAYDELAGWPIEGSEWTVDARLEIYGTNVDDVVSKCSEGCSVTHSGVSLRHAIATSGIDMKTLCEQHLPVVFLRPGVVPCGRSRVQCSVDSQWEAGKGKCLIERDSQYWTAHWKKYDETGRLVKWAPPWQFAEFVWMTNQHAAISARLRGEWAKKHNMTVEQAEKRVEELLGVADAGKRSMGATGRQGGPLTKGGLSLRERREQRRNLFSTK